MSKVVRCFCDNPKCKKPFHEWVYKKGDSMDNKDLCPECRKTIKLIFI